MVVQARSEGTISWLVVSTRICFFPNTMRLDFQKWFCIISVTLLLAGCDSRKDRIEAAEAKGRAAELLHQKGEYAQAVAVGREALGALVKLLGSDDPKTIHCRYNLSGYLVAADQRDEAIAEGRKLLASSIRVFGEEHDESLYSRLQLASALREVNNMEGNIDAKCAEEAEALYQAVIQSAATSEMVLRARHGLGVLYGRMGKHEEAVKQITIVLEAERLNLGNEADEVLATRLNLASALMAQKLFEPAQKEFQIVYDLRKKRLGDEHPQTIRAKDWLAHCISDQGRLEEAIPMIREVWNAKRRTLGDGNRASLVAGFNLAVAELNGGYRDEAIRVLEETHRQALKALGPEDSQTQMYQNALDKVR
jgi:tetratricopeptide (TPR) repeat protein